MDTNLVAAVLLFGLLPTASAQTAPVMPVTNGLVCWYDASAAQTNASGTVTNWVDQSGGAHHATSGGGAPTLALNDINSRPAVHFRGSNTYLNCNPQGGMFTKQQYLVVRSPNATWNGSGSFLGRASQDFLSVRVGSYNLANGTTGFWQDHYPIAVSKNGTVLGGAPFALTPITSYMILKITVDQPDPGNIASYPNYQIGKNETLGTMDFDVAEIIGYGSALSSGDEALVGAYLAKKYGLTTAYPTVTSTSTALALTGGSTPAAVGSALTFTATVAGFAPTGSVTFYDGSTTLGTGTVNGSAQASHTTSSLAVGTHSITARYAGDAGNAASVSTVLYVQVANAADILSFTFPGLAVATINGTAISATVPYATDVTALAPTYTTLPGATGVPVSATVRNFTAPQTYVINGSKTYTVTVTKIAASTAKDILACDFGTLGAAVINGTNIVLTVPPTQSRTLAPTFTISPLATLNPPSGSTNDFTNPVTYTVTAENGSTKTYAMTVQTYESWTHHGSLFILTTPEGANLAASASETNFPLLVRLNATNFNFAETQSDGRDIRFSTVAGAPLAYEIEQWDAANGQAAVWVKIPVITGNARQEIRMHWGKAGITSESSGSAVFNATNGYASVLHMNETVSDAVGTATPTNAGTTLVTGMIGKGRNFTAGQGIAAAANITAYPSGANPHSTQAWIKPVTNTANVLGWGMEQGWGRVLIQLAKPQFNSPVYMNVNCYSGGGSVSGSTPIALSTWMHVAHTYKNGEAKTYVNGVPDGTNTSGTMNIPTPLGLYLGGWNGSYNYAGDMDEVRISKVTRSANWIRLEYENQKPLQTLAGSLVQDGSAFSVTPVSVTMNEGSTTTLTAQAGGAQKVYWILKQNGQETIVAVDQLSYALAVGRVTGDQSFVLQFKAIYPTGVQTTDIPVTVTDSIPDPVFTLTAPAIWDGRQTIAVTPDISNLAALQAAGVAGFTYSWSVAGLAVSNQITPGVLTLTRAQGSGPLSVTLTMANGGSPVTVTQTITVQEPASDAWVQRTPGATEKPVNGQFFARDPNTGMGTIYYNGTQSGSPTSVFLKVYTTDTGADVPYGSVLRQTLVAGAYSFAAPIAAGKVTYKVVYGTTNGAVDTNVATVTDLVCGDAYIVDGQSNALGLDNAAPNDLTTDKWIRTYGSSGGGWGYAVSKGSEMYLGLLAWDLAKGLSTDHNLPICIINGAVGGTRIDQHMPNPADHYAAGASYSIYANLLNRVAGAKLTHGIRGVFWHQGESNSGADSPTGDWDYKSYQQYFIDMSMAWKQDYPNIQRYLVYQVWPKPCSMGPKGDQLREVQRTLPRLYSNMSILSTIGITEPWNTVGLCHFDAAGYQQIADLSAPLMARDFYGATPAGAVTAPNLRRAYYTTSSHNEIALEFDQDMSPNNFATVNFYLDRVAGKVTGVSASGKVVKLALNGSSTSQTIDYVEDAYWNGSPANLLYGTNSIAALTFADVPLTLPVPTALIATPDNIQVVLNWTASAGATGYKVKRALTSGGPYSVIATPSGTSYTDTTGTNSTTYYYVVSATSGTDESADSAEASAIINVIGTGVSTTTLVRHSGTGSSTTYGDALSFDVTVSGSTTPTGVVTLRDGGAGGTTIGSAPLAGGACTISPALNALTPGSHNNLVAVYSGDIDYASSASSALGTQTVSPKALTVTGTTVTPRTYDGTLTATLTGATLGGVVGGDTVTLANATSGTFSSKDIGVGKTVTTSMTLAGASAANYTLIQPVLTGAITVKALTITGMTANTKTYDGTTAAVLTGGTLSGGVVGGESVTVSTGTGSFANANAGIWAVTASGYALGGTHAGNYVLSAQPVVPNATIIARPVQLTGTRIYDGTTAAAAGILALSNKVSGDDLSLTGGVTLAAKDVGSQGLVSSIGPPTYVQNKTGTLTGGGSATSFNVTALTTAPTAGNTLVAVISTCNSSQNSVASIGATSGTALNWQRAVQSTVVANGTTTEVWYATVLAGAGSTVTINLAGTGYAAAAVVAEYRGVLTSNPVDQVAGTSGTSSTNPASTGTTPSTTQANDLAFGGIGLVYHTSGTFSGISGGTQITNVASASATSRVRLYAISTTVTTPATVSFTGTMNTAQNWSGVIATFKAPSISGLSLSGAAAGNYTLAGATGAVAITPKTLTVTGLTASGKTYDGTTTAALTGTAALAAAETAGTGTTADGKPYSGDAITLGGTATGTFMDPNAGTAKPVTISGKTLTGAQAGNYTLTQPAGLTAAITPAALTVTADNQNKTYGQTATFGSGSTQFTSSGLQNGESIGSVTLACVGGDATAAVATYPITPGAATGGTFSAANYTISYVPGTLTVNPAPVSPFATWAGDPVQGLTAGVNDGPMDDPDHDGMTNFQEFAFGLNPSNGSSVNPVTMPLDQAAGRFQYTRRAGSGLTYQIFTTTNMGTWNPDTGATEVAVTTSGEVETVTVHVTTPPLNGKLFVRVQAQ